MIPHYWDSHVKGGEAVVVLDSYIHLNSLAADWIRKSKLNNYQLLVIVLTSKSSKNDEDGICIWDKVISVIKKQINNTTNN